MMLYIPVLDICLFQITIISEIENHLQNDHDTRLAWYVHHHLLHSDSLKFMKIEPVCNQKSRIEHTRRLPLDPPNQGLLFAIVPLKNGLGIIHLLKKGTIYK